VFEDYTPMMRAAIEYGGEPWRSATNPANARVYLTGWPMLADGIHIRHVTDRFTGVVTATDGWIGGWQFGPEVAQQCLEVKAYVDRDGFHPTFMVSVPFAKQRRLMELALEKLDSKTAMEEDPGF